MNSNLKVGSNNAGLFVGNTEILGGGYDVYIGDAFFDDSNTGPCIVVCNETDNTKSFDVFRDWMSDIDKEFCFTIETPAKTVKFFDVMTVDNNMELITKDNIVCDYYTNSYYYNEEQYEVIHAEKNSHFNAGDIVMRSYRSYPIIVLRIKS